MLTIVYSIAAVIWKWGTKEEISQGEGTKRCVLQRTTRNKTKTTDW